SAMCYPRVIWVVRHCEREDNVNRQWKKLPGMSVFEFDNSPLSQRGRAQAQELGKRFRNEAIAQVFASPFDRTIETAHVIVEMNENKNLNVKPEPGLCEALYLCAKPAPSFWDAKELKEKFPRVDEEYDPVFSKYTLPKEGCGDDECVPRLKTTIERLVQRYAGPILLVGHGASIGAIHEVLTNDFKYVGQATVTKFVQSGHAMEEIKLVYSSCTKHLSDPHNLRPW
ncbi:hypothetical protein PENTCL1PPCAC_23759, partial [Pristionchus entomophagus]